MKEKTEGGQRLSMKESSSCLEGRGKGVYSNTEKGHEGYVEEKGLSTSDAQVLVQRASSYPRKKSSTLGRGSAYRKLGSEGGSPETEQGR